MKIHPTLFFKGQIVRHKGHKQKLEVLDATNPDDLPDHVETIEEALPFVRYLVRNVKTSEILEGERHYLLEPL